MSEPLTPAEIAELLDPDKMPPHLRESFEKLGPDAFLTLVRMMAATTTQEVVAAFDDRELVLPALVFGLLQALVSDVTPDSIHAPIDFGVMRPEMFGDLYGVVWDFMGEDVRIAILPEGYRPRHRRWWQRRRRR